MTALQEPMNLGDLLKYEESSLRYSREQITVAVGQNLELGAVVGRVSATGRIKRMDPLASDGSEHPAGVLLQPCDATLIERDDVCILARHGGGLRRERSLALFALLMALAMLPPMKLTNISPRMACASSCGLLTYSRSCSAASCSWPCPLGISCTPAATSPACRFIEVCRALE